MAIYAYEIHSLSNKAVYTTAPVAYGWAGAVMQVKSPFGVFLHCMTDGEMDQQLLIELHVWDYKSVMCLKCKFAIFGPISNFDN